MPRSLNLHRIMGVCISDDSPQLIMKHSIRVPSRIRGYTAVKRNEMNHYIHINLRFFPFKNSSELLNACVHHILDRNLWKKAQYSYSLLIAQCYYKIDQFKWWLSLRQYQHKESRLRSLLYK